MSLHVVLVHPEIHWNTGNAGRSCLAAGATLHLVKPLGFSLGERELKRAGLDYWEHVDLRLWESWDDFEGNSEPSVCHTSFQRRALDHYGTSHSARHATWSLYSAERLAACLPRFMTAFPTGGDDADPVASRPVIEPVDFGWDRLV